MKQKDQISYLDIVFNGRNKNYGAYELRTNYSKRLFIALGSTLIFCAMLLFSSFVLPTKEPDKHVIVEDIVLVDVIAPISEVVKKEELPQQVLVKTVKFTVPVVVDNSEADIVSEISSDVKIGIKNVDGPVIDSVQAATTDIPTTHTEVVVEKVDVEVKSVDIEATFPGGFVSWKQFLQTTLDPSIPLENDAPGGTYKVTVSFLVDKDGSISEVKALNDPGYGIAAEAVKVIKKSKVWNPAISNNVKVIYRQKQVIVFQVNAD
jgi:protein TonB